MQPRRSTFLSGKSDYPLWIFFLSFFGCCCLTQLHWQTSVARRSPRHVLPSWVFFIGISTRWGNCWLDCTLLAGVPEKSTQSFVIYLIYRCQFREWPEKCAISLKGRGVINCGVCRCVLWQEIVLSSCMWCRAQYCSCTCVWRGWAAPHACFTDPYGGCGWTDSPTRTSPYCTNASASSGSSVSMCDWQPADVIVVINHKRACFCPSSLATPADVHALIRSSESPFLARMPSKHLLQREKHLWHGENVTSSLISHDFAQGPWILPINQQQICITFTVDSFSFQPFMDVESQRIIGDNR